MSAVDVWKSVDLTSYEGRLNTFQDRSIPYIKPEDLAKSGFFYIGNGSVDAVKCFSCEVSLGRWEKGDDSQEKHKKASPKCAYVLNPTPVKVLAMHPEFNTFNARLKTFGSPWVCTKNLTYYLAEAGFFSFGKSDFCKCYYCGAVLYEWRIWDQPWKVHAFWSPGCDYVRIVKGLNFINNTINEENECYTYNKSECQDISKENLCTVCFDHEISVMLMPCGHVFCPSCARSVDVCPACRANIKERNRCIV